MRGAAVGADRDGKAGRVAQPARRRIDPATHSSACVSPPPNSTTGSTTAPDLIGAAADGFGAFQDAQRRSLARLSRSNPGGFAMFLGTTTEFSDHSLGAITDASTFQSAIWPLPSLFTTPGEMGSYTSRYGDG